MTDWLSFFGSIGGSCGTNTSDRPGSYRYKEKGKGMAYIEALWTEYAEEG